MKRPKIATSSRCERRCFLTIPTDRPARSQFFRDAYDIRSTLAHGGEVDESELRELDGNPGTVERYAAVLSDYMRLLLGSMIAMAIRGDALPIRDWNEFTFRRLDRQATD